MLAVAVACLALAGIVSLAAYRLLRLERREHVRQAQAWTEERAQLVDRICNLAGKPWTPPPRLDNGRAEPPTVDELEASRIARRW